MSESGALGFEQAGYRRALGAFATGVAVVTAPLHGGRAVATTINSFASVSLDPPLVLWSLDNSSKLYPVYAEARRWAVSVLPCEAEALARRFAFEERLPAEAHELEAVGEVPALRGAIARFACVTHEARPLGDHLLIVGRVTAFDERAGDGLGFFRSRFFSASNQGS